MKRTICIVSSCITLAVLMMVQTYAISSYNAYSYWSTANNELIWQNNMENIQTIATYSKINGMNPPNSLRSELYTGGYYSNQMALFSSNTNLTANFNLYGQRNIFAWSYNGTGDNGGTSLLDVGFTKWTDGTSVVLNDNSCVIGPYSSALFKGVGKSVSENVEIYSIRMQSDGINDLTNFSRIGFKWEYNDVNYYFRFSFNGTQYGCEASPYFTNNSFGGITGNFSQTGFHDYQFIIAANRILIYIDGVLIRDMAGTTNETDNPLADKDSGIYIWSQKYQRTFIQSISGSVASLPQYHYQVNLGKPVTIPAGDSCEFYIHMTEGAVTNNTSQSTVNFSDSFSYPYMTWVFQSGDDVNTDPQYQDGWIYCYLEPTNEQRTLTHINLISDIPFVIVNSGDSLTYEIDIALSDVIIGSPDDIGYNPSIDPNENKFRQDVVNGLNDVKQEIHDGFDIINGTLEDVRQEIQDGFDMVEDALSRDDTFDDVTASPDADIEHVVPESDALIQYEQIMADANQTLLDADLLGAQSFWQDVFNSVLTIPMAGMMAVISSSLLILRALLGR